MNEAVKIGSYEDWKMRDSRGESRWSATAGPELNSGCMQ